MSAAGSSLPFNAKHKTPMATLATALLVLIALGGCASKELPPQDNGFCLYQPLPDPADAVNLKVRGNKIAILTNEQTYDRECRLGSRANSLGPR